MKRRIPERSKLAAPRRAIGALALALGLLTPVAAQEPADSAGTLPAEPTELVFEREVFDYPSFERRNPFAALTSATSGPRFEQITLRGIIYSPDPRRSVALLATGVVAAQPGATGGETRRVRVGESWGNTRVLEIHQDEVVVEVENFGVLERRVMQLERRRGQGGS